MLKTSQLLQYNGIRVQKAGGGVLGRGNGIHKLFNIIGSYDGPQLVVVSALEGDTEKLKLFAQTRDWKYAESVLQGYREIAEQFIRDKTVHQRFLGRLKFYKSMLKNPEDSNPENPIDAIAPVGEMCCSELMYHLGMARGKDYGKIDLEENPIKVDERKKFKMDSHPDLAKSKANSSIVKEKLARHGVLFAPGYFAADNDGMIWTLGSGGSDLTAVVYGHILEVPHIILWKEVGGVRTSDPKYVNRTRHITHLTYRVAGVITKYGGKVVQPKAAKTASELDITLGVAYIRNPRIITEISNKDSEKQRVQYVGGSTKAVVIEDRKETMDKVEEFCERYDIGDRFHILRGDTRTRRAMLLDGSEVLKKTSVDDKITYRRETSFVAATGEGIEKVPGIIDKAIHPLARKDIVIRDIGSGGQTEPCFFLCMDQSAWIDSLRIMHNELVLRNGGL